MSLIQAITIRWSVSGFPTKAEFVRRPHSWILVGSGVSTTLCPAIETDLGTRLLRILAFGVGWFR